MSLDLESIGQLSLLEQGSWRSIISVEPSHRLVVLCKSLLWAELMEKAIPILYDEQGIACDSGGRKLNLRAHLGAYILQTVHGWTDRWTEEMVRFYFPARIFCGYLDSQGSLDHTKIEEFRNRFGEKGASLITEDIVRIAKEFGFTKGDDVDMDTTVQESGITHHTEMKLMNHLMKRLAISGKLKAVSGRGIVGIKALSEEFKKAMAHYRFFAKPDDSKSKSAFRNRARETQSFSPWPKCVRKTSKADSIGNSAAAFSWAYWLRRGKVAPGKIISLWKLIPKAIPKGKIGKPVEFGRKWIVNAYRGG